MTLEQLIAEAGASEPSHDLAERVVPLIDLTSLSGTESEPDIRELCNKAVDAGVAAICVYPQYLEIAEGALGASAIARATVVNFPSGDDDIQAACGEIAAALGLGASEIDLVAPYKSAVDGDIGIVGEMVEAAKAACGPDIPLKVILETGALPDAALMTAVARAAVMAGADMLKTSTGKIAQGASLGAAALLLEAIKESDGAVGLKLSGGIRTARDVAGYLHLIDTVMGRDWVSPKKVRFGASSLLAALRPV